MKAEIMKLRTEQVLIRMGYSSVEAKDLIQEYWSQVEYLKTARAKALYITA